jgi:hypothetical protein
MPDYTYLNNVPAPRIHKSNAQRVYEDAKDMVNFYQRKILALAVSSGQNMKDEEGSEIFWPDYVLTELEQIFEDYDEQLHKMFLSKYIIDNPEDVSDELDNEKEKSIYEQVEKLMVEKYIFENPER